MLYTFTVFSVCFFSQPLQGRMRRQISSGPESCKHLSNPASSVQNQTYKINKMKSYSQRQQAAEERNDLVIENI